jgi:NAD(P)-dependent dehydrogenase (short-subunit alcohol dehydrogenase family)
LTVCVSKAAEAVHRLEFAAGDLERFAAASGDRNPLHLDAGAARATAFGRPVVHGTLGVWRALGCLTSRRDRHLARLTVEFPGAMFTGVAYAVHVLEDEADGAEVEIREEDRVLLTMSAVFAPGRFEAAATAGAPAGRAEPAELDVATLAEATAIEGEYAPNAAALPWLRRQADLEDVGVGASQQTALLWASYLVGMELPGARALLSGIALRFETAAGPPPWRYRVADVRFDDRFDLLRYRATLTSASGAVATGELKAFVRRDVPRMDAETLASLLPGPAALRDRIVAVTGASRGLGAALARGLALSGAIVHANYLRSHAAAAAVARRADGAPGTVELVPGDVSDASWCRRLREAIDREHGGLDALVCNACLPLMPLAIGPTTASRVGDYVRESLAQVVAPVSALVGSLEAREGCLVVISSAAVAEESPPPGWPHYVSAKCAIEGFARVVAQAHRHVRVLIVRPPRLATDLTNTPLGHTGAVPPERIAAAIIRALAGFAPGAATPEGGDRVRWLTRFGEAR